MSEHDPDLVLQELEIFLLNFASKTVNVGKVKIRVAGAGSHFDYKQRTSDAF